MRDLIFIFQIIHDPLMMRDLLFILWIIHDPLTKFYTMVTQGNMPIIRGIQFIV